MAADLCALTREESLLMSVCQIDMSKQTDRLIQTSDKTVKEHYWLGHWWRTQGEYNKAEEVFLKLLQQLLDSSQCEQQYDYYGEPVKRTKNGEPKRIKKLRHPGCRGNVHERIEKLRYAESGWIVTTLSDLGFTYNLMGNKGLIAVEYIRKAYDLAKQLHGNGSLSHQMLVAFQYLGTAHATRGEYETAKGYAMQHLELCEQCYGPKHRAVAMALNNLGRRYIQLNQHYQASLHLDRAIDMFDELGFGDTRSKANSLHNLSDCYDGLGLYEKALQTMIYKRINPLHRSIPRVMADYYSISKGMLLKNIVSLDGCAGVSSVLSNLLKVVTIYITTIQPK